MAIEPKKAQKEEVQGVSDLPIPTGKEQAYIPPEEERALGSIFESADGTVSSKEQTDVQDEQVDPVAETITKEIDGQEARAVPVLDDRTGEPAYWTGTFGNTQLVGRFESAEAVFKYIKGRTDGRMPEPKSVAYEEPEEARESRRVAHRRPVVKENLVAQWVNQEIGKAIASLAVQITPQDASAIEDAVWQTALAGRLGDGSVSDATSKAIQDIVQKLTAGIPQPASPEPPSPDVQEPPSSDASAETEDDEDARAGASHHDDGKDEEEEEEEAEESRQIQDRRKGRKKASRSAKAHPMMQLRKERRLSSRETMLERAVDEALRKGVDAGVEMILDAEDDTGVTPGAPPDDDGIEGVSPGGEKYEAIIDYQESGPGKFEGEGNLGEWLYQQTMDGSNDELGDVEGFGWYGLLLFSKPVLVREDGEDAYTFQAAICSEGNTGFFSAETYDTEEEANDVWAKIEAEYAEFEGASDEEE